MSQRNKKHQARHNNQSRAQKSTRAEWRSVWPLFALGGLLIVGALFVLIRGSQNQTDQQTGAGSSAPQVTGAPRVAVSQDTLDYGNVNLGRTITSVFTVRNVGDRDLIILGEPAVQVVEGC